MLCKLIFLLIPFFFLIVLQQLHLIPSYIATIVYIICCTYYCLVKEEKLPIFLRNVRNSFKTGNVLTFLFLIIITTFPIGGYLAVPLIMPHSTETADAVVVLASGATQAGEPHLATYQRIIHGAELVKSGQAKHLYISTGYGKINGFLEYYAVASLTQMLNIPQDKITIFKSEEIVTTATEAGYIKKYMDKKGINKILLTTSNAHIYRSYLTFKKIGFQVLPAPSHNKKTTVYADNNSIMFRAAMHEWIGLAWYFLMGRI